jgi:D-alanine-D-alanine ligase
MITDKKIGVLAGGVSAEREVSLRSGEAVYKALKERGYDVALIDTAENFHESLVSESVEIAFIALHGGYGENGAIQGMLEVLGIPYTGSGVLASALAMDKEASKKIFLYHGIPVPAFVFAHRSELPACPRDMISGSVIGGAVIDFDMPWVVKPVAEGSSIGVHIVRTADQMPAAVKDALKYGDKIVIEQYIRGKEVQIGILGDRALGGVEVRPSLEFYNYEAKYTPGLTQYVLPPEVSADDYEKLRSTALAAHKALGCAGATRVDLILDSAGNTYILEVNTIPGMTETSLLPKIARLDGLEFIDLIEEIVKSSVSGGA